MFRKRWNPNCIFDFWRGYITCPGAEELLPRAYTSDPDGALLVGQLLLLLAEAHLAGQAQPAPSTHRSQTITIMELAALGELQGSSTFCGRSPQRCHWVPSPPAGQALTTCPLTHRANDKVQSLQMHTFPKFSSLRTMWSSLTVIYSPGLYVLATYGTNFTAIFRWCNEIKWHGHSHKGMATLMQTLGKAPCF